MSNECEPRVLTSTQNERKVAPPQPEQLQTSGSHHEIALVDHIKNISSTLGGTTIATLSPSFEVFFRSSSTLFPPSCSPLFPPSISRTWPRRALVHDDLRDHPHLRDEVSTRLAEQSAGLRITGFVFPTQPDFEPDLQYPTDRPNQNHHPHLSSRDNCSPRTIPTATIVHIWHRNGESSPGRWTLKSPESQSPTTLPPHPPPRLRQQPFIQ